MFWIKYKPSVKANNELKEKAVKEIKAIIYKLEKGRFDENLKKEVVEKIISDLKAAAEGLEYAIGTGEENVLAISEEVKKQIKAFKKQTEQSMSGRIEGAADELIYTLTLWKDVTDGTAVLETEEDVKKAKTSRTKKKLDGRLNELDEIRESFASNSKRLDKDIAMEEKDLAEMEEQMLAEDNERKINDLYRKIQAAKSKIDMMTVRQNCYSSCFSLLDEIYANASEILNASDFAATETAKAKVLLNIGKLKQVMDSPDKALAILGRMKKDLQDSKAKTDMIDNKVAGLNGGNAQINENALRYKEELMRKKREKEGLGEDITAAAIEETETTTIKEGN